MQEKHQGNNKLEPAAEASANANLADNADINDQHAVLNAIASLKQDLVAKIEEKAIAQSAELQIQTTQIRTELRSVVEQVNKKIEVTEGRVSELDAVVSSHSDSITCMTSDVTAMKKELATLRDRCEDLEARSRRCNIRIIGVKEGREHGKHPSQFVADMLKVSLGLDKPPTLDRAHRALRSRPTQDGLPPRAFIVKCHYFSEKESLLKKAIEMKSVTTPDSDQIRLLLDFTQAVSKQRAAFTEVRGLLWGCEGVRYGLKYPAILMITTSGGRKASFSDPKTGNGVCS
ncbi:LINE-1 type transposase domain containing protein 1 [Dissostichus eleginoides]|uniref:LINE-1 type transposase domain containing protein 1 n=1 Tax=Dissostichus eleginoides TaxID=100907 RepID=A0AAD9BY48_DISEL|nr:LINE-1 type transposase domain containing protein 1 [Dissostichus eleginoides]